MFRGICDVYTHWTAFHFSIHGHSLDIYVLGLICVHVHVHVVHGVHVLK